ncbi:hypothetical protein PF007_g27728 [Phytophthora fragariae]|uniref:Uncharacterized protein n=1 Tax=Phytophthora fragariae TaxID=53985 RepID=A0A6A4BJ88_9STRA|nr:hypothetical protein PF003_g30174 [Phytophthora fragariae]KAE8983994.1 hypothetical protein PF011_g20951 [Phytophthora fragariae]KAE9068337.1 hypothetical protein PF007_g27728 [Phytophthora fragariae]KAE9080209.1 hypothetical protein PF006_g27362 [Phytophthora fragariae]KAE9274680.1 hypothetical protein PF001_g26951 [Phytophthora fragariae]
MDTAWIESLTQINPFIPFVFVAKNKSADPTNTPGRVRLTLLYVNKFVGTALGHMQADNLQWWSGFCDALRSIDYQSPAWTMALLSILTQASDGDRHQGQTGGRRGNEGRREGTGAPRSQTLSVVSSQ